MPKNKREDYEKRYELAGEAISLTMIGSPLPQYRALLALNGIKEPSMNQLKLDLAKAREKGAKFESGVNADLVLRNLNELYYKAYGEKRYDLALGVLKQVIEIGGLNDGRYAGKVFDVKEVQDRVKDV